MNFAFSHPWALLLGPLALLPLLRRTRPGLAYSSFLMLPEDRLSTVLDRGLRALAAAAILTLAGGIAGPHVREQWVEKVGVGAHIVLLVDHSASMNENFATRYLGGAVTEAKSAIASRLLADLVGRRKDDLFALVAFSAAPIDVLSLTQDRDAVQAGIRALAGRGHGVTNIAPALATALEHFRGRPLTSSRVVLLVSDGAARMEEEARDALRQMFQDARASLYWIYLRNPRSGRLSAPPDNPNESTSPEYFLHRYFQTLGVPYRAYETENPQALQVAIQDVEKLQNQPLRYRERIPRQDWSGACFGAALVCLLILLAMKPLEVRTWPG
ncbi:MAG TPA: vWA domain-containing protein [Methylococcaceae bacterium]|nr:vWA domain-containing protein [Methylococcaceae bacterium]